MKWYAAGNMGWGSEVFAFGTKQKRDHYVAFGKDEGRKKLTRKQARRRRYVWAVDEQREIDLLHPTRGEKGK